MNIREKNKKEMLGNVSGFYNLEKAAFTGMPGLNASFSDIIAINKEVELNEKVIQEGTKGKVISRDDSQAELIKTALVIAGAVYGYAASKNDLELLTAVDISSSTFKKMRDAEIPIRVEKILESATALGGELLPFGVSEELLNSSKTKLDDYVTKFGGVYAGRGSKKAAAESTKKLLAKSELKLKVLDKLMLSFKTSDADLYSRYEAARMIYDKRGKRSNGSEPANQEAAQG